MLEYIFNVLFCFFVVYMLTGVLFAMLRSPRFYEFILWVATSLGTYHYTTDIRASLMAFVFSGLFILLADTAFQRGRKRTPRKLTCPIDSRNQIPD
jgi:hypothetical protein